MQAIIIILLILAVLLVIFTLQNSMEITINVFFWKISNAPLVLVIVGCIVIGFIVATFYFYPRIWKLKKEYNQLIKFNKELKNLQEMENKKGREKGKVVEFDEEGDPEGIEMDEEEEDDDSFFKD